jgi:single-strand DNA-binding protein
MAGLNKVQLIGHLGKAPEVKNLDNGKNVGVFTLATTENWKDKATGEKKTKTEWHNIVVWGGLADVAAKFLEVGKQVYIEGKLSTRSWDDDKIKLPDGKPLRHWRTEIIADDLQMLGPAPSQSSQTLNHYAQQGNEQLKQGSNEPSAPLPTEEPDWVKAGGHTSKVFPKDA